MINQKLYEESTLRIGYLLFFVTAVGFICSLAYNYGYFWLFEAGIRMLSIDDILKSYTLWVPGLSTLFFGYALDLFIKRIEKDKTEKQIAAAWKRHGLTKSIKNIPEMVLYSAIVGLLIYYVLFGDPYKPLIIWAGCSLLWVRFSGYLLSSRLFAGRTNKLILGLFLFTPVILSLMFSLGLDKSLSESKLNKANANLYFIDNPNVAYPTILLRPLEKGLLAKEIEHDNYVLFNWTGISRIEVIAHNSRFKGILCDWFHWSCQFTP